MSDDDLTKKIRAEIADALRALAASAQGNAHGCVDFHDLAHVADIVAGKVKEAARG